MLYLGCLSLGVALGYLEFRFHILKQNWDQYLLLSACVYFALSYRFDNRLVLSLGLSSLAGWFGLRAGVHHSLFGPIVDAASLRPYALAYGSVVAAAGVLLHRPGIKRHFLEAYLHVAANVLLTAVLSGVAVSEHQWLYLMVLCVARRADDRPGHSYPAFRVCRVWDPLRVRRHQHPGAARHRWDTHVFAYFTLSGVVVIAGLVMLARRFGREE